MFPKVKQNLKKKSKLLSIDEVEIRQCNINKSVLISKYNIESSVMPAASWQMIAVFITKITTQTS